MEDLHSKKGENGWEQAQKLIEANRVPLCSL